MDSDGFVTTNLTYLTEFAALFFKSFSSVELAPLMTYYLNRIKEGDNYYETFQLSAILKSMIGFKDLEIATLNPKQLLSLA
jgi:hypothetical protein